MPGIEVTTAVYTADNDWLSVAASVTYEGPAGLDRYVEQLAILVLRNTFGVHPGHRVPDIDLAEVNARAAAFGVTVTGFRFAVLGPGPERVEPSSLPDFTVVLRGYARREVDELVAAAREALTAPERRPAVAELLRKPLPLALRGYDRSQVDAYLATLAKLLGTA